MRLLADARMLYITGSGDPFGSPFFRRWLQTMSRSAMPKLERIHLHTNGLLWTKRIWESIPERHTRADPGATISIDAATPQTYAVNRRGGDFETLLERLAFIGESKRTGPLEYLEIHMTVQANNYKEMPQFLELGRRHHCDRVSFHQLLDWGTFSPREYRISRRAIPRTSRARGISRDAERQRSRRSNRLYVQFDRNQAPFLWQFHARAALHATG